MSKFLQILKVLLFVLIGFGILYLMYQNQQEAYYADCIASTPDADCNLMTKIIADFKSVRWVWIFTILGIYMISNVARTYRWQQILRADGYQPGFINSIGTLMIGYFVNLGIPRAGEFVRTGMLSNYEKIPIEKSLASVVIDRVADIIALLVIISITLLLVGGDVLTFLSENVKSSTLYLLGGVAAVGFIGGVIGIIIIRRLISQGSDNWFVQKANSFIDGLKAVTQLESVPKFITYTVIIWVCYYLMTYLCFFSFGPTAHLSAKAGLMIFVLGTLGIVFPSPGGMGSYHFLVMNGLLLYGIGSTDAFSFANIVFFAIQLFCNVILGLFFLILLPIYNSGKIKVEAN